MTSIILALALGQSLNLNDTPVRQGRGFDGGVTWGVFCVNCSGGGGSGGTVTQGTGFDGGGFWNVRSVLFNSGNTEVGTLLNPLQVNATPLEADSFSAAVVATRYNQVEIDYSTTAPASISDITITTSGGGGSANSGGQAVFSTSTGATGSVKAVTNTTISYRPQAEVYAAFSAVFTTGTAGSIQRLGIYDANNGFFLGYEGTSFGVTLRKAGVESTFVRIAGNGHGGDRHGGQQLQHQPGDLHRHGGQRAEPGGLQRQRVWADADARGRHVRHGRQCRRAHRRALPAARVRRRCRRRVRPALARDDRRLAEGADGEFQRAGVRRHCGGRPRQRRLDRNHPQPADPGAGSASRTAREPPWSCVVIDMNRCLLG